jgi:ABC-type amino acid transport substrate-binding protein
LSFAIIAVDPGAQQSYAQSDNAVLRVATYMDFPPFIADTEPDNGIISAIVMESFIAADMNAKTLLVPWRRAYRAVKLGEFSASYSWAYSEQRASEFHLSEPIFAISNQIITTYSDISDWEQLKEARDDGTIPIMCVPTGWNIGPEITDLIDEGLIQRVSPGHPRFCIDLVRANRTNVLYMPMMTINYHLRALQMSDNDPGTPSLPPLYALDLPSGHANTHHILFTRNAKGLANKKRFDAGFKILVESGRYKEILDRHLNSYVLEDREAIYRDQENAGILPHS